MSTTSPTAAHRTLLDHLERRDTGRLKVGRGPSLLVVFVVDGEIVAAHSADDPKAILRRLVLAGALPRDEAAIIGDGPVEDAWESILESARPELLDAVFHDRYIENLTRFVAATARPTFTALPMVLVENMHLGHDASVLVDGAVAAAADALRIELDAVLDPGIEDPQTVLEQIVVRLCRRGLDVATLLDEVPSEPLTTRALLYRMVDADVLHRRGDPEVPNPVGEPVGYDPAEDIDDDPTSPSEPTPLPAVEREAANQELDLATDEQSTDVVESPEPDAQVDSEGAGDLSSLSAWMNHGVEVEEDLDAFGDHDQDRGAAIDPDADAQQDGAFTTEAHNLDKVEVVDTLDEVIEVGETPGAKYSAPVLSYDDLTHKVEVANSVLSVIAEKMDASAGAGSGQTTIQLMIDGSAGPHVHLFHGIKADEDGEIDEDDLLHNIQAKPPTEHRRMVNQGLLDLIDRALSYAMEELPDEAIDEVLETTVGYRQRMGL